MSVYLCLYLSSSTHLSTNNMKSEVLIPHLA